MSDGRHTVVDVHAHLLPLAPERAAKLDGVRVVDGPRLEIDGRAVMPDALYRPEALIEWMDTHGIERALISVPPSAYRPHLDADSARAWAGYLNDGLEAAAARHPGRLAALCHLPLEHPEVALNEIGRRDGPHTAGFAIEAGGPEGAPTYSAAELEPVWRALAARAAFVFTHPGHCSDHRLKPYYLHNLLGNPHETAVAVAHLVFGGVLERHPKIRFCLAHCGGTVPAVAGRLQRGFETARPGVDTALAPPAFLLRRFLVDCIAHDPALIALAAEVFGPDRIVFGSDWPFPMGLPDPQAQLAMLAPELREAILHADPLRADPLHADPSAVPEPA